MSFDEKIIALAKKAENIASDLQTEEATKNALVMPFINALGYDIFNPKEVVPEFTADVGTKKGEKVDYAILEEEEVIILIECKHATCNLSDANVSQLYRYFSTTKARIAILTNGVQYQLYSDLEEPNKMDSRPFLELDLLNLREHLLIEMKKLCKEDFDLDRMLTTANELKYTSAIKKLLLQQFDDPGEEIVKYCFNATNPGARFVASNKKPFTEYVKSAFYQLISEKVRDRLSSALEKEDEKTIKNDSLSDKENCDDTTKNGIVTTEEELEGFRIVRAIVCQQVDPERIVHRDTKSYFGILFDDNRRKPICRLHFNTSKKYISIFDEEKKDSRHPIDNLADIYKFSNNLVQTAVSYLNQE